MRYLLFAMLFLSGQAFAHDQELEFQISTLLCPDQAIEETLLRGEAQQSRGGDA